VVVGQFRRHAADRQAQFFDDRRAAYERDVTYTTVQECGFDFLRDRLRLGVDADEAGRDAAHGLVQRPLWASVVDEADSILLDSARTPLIIAAQAPVDPVDEALARWADGLATRLGPEADFVAEPAHKRVTLTTDGCRRVSLAGVPHGCAAEHRYELVETALNARLLHQRDRDYVVTPEDEIGIIDIGTGRQKEGSRWQHGLHRAIEIKEGVPLAGESASTASITVQRYVRGYRKRCGMTGTSRPSAGEIRRTYRLKTVVIPTNRPCIRRGRPTRIYATAAAKHEAIAVECRDMLASGRAVLIGTPSIEISEQVAAALDRHGIDSMLLHARKRDREARIVAEAGQPGRVTVATNMAGRGTDIKLAESVRDAGGLHVIATEMHHSRRVDRQLIGRAARQGDPGSYRFMLSLEDELLDALPAARRGRLRRSVAGREKLPADRWIGLFRRLQKRVDAQHRRDRAYATRTEKRSRAALRRMGLCPYLESAAE
ncbi:MAG: helicase-related protein, partial [Planctomycetota bacterium]